MFLKDLKFRKGKDFPKKGLDEILQISRQKELERETSVREEQREFKIKDKIVAKRPLFKEGLESSS